MIITIDGNIPSKFAHSFNVMKMAQGFKLAGEDVELLTLQSWPLIKNRIKLGNIWNHYGITEKFRISRVLPDRQSFLTKAIGASGYYEKAEKYIIREKPNFLYARSFALALMGIKNNIPTILETHTTKLDGLKIFEKIASVSSSKSFIALITIHENLKKLYGSYGIPANKIFVLEDGVDLSGYKNFRGSDSLKKKLGLPIRKKIIMYSGGLYPEKGIEDILMSAKNLNDYKDLAFILIGGDKEQITYWRKFALQMEISNVTFLGFKMNSLIPKYLQLADVLLMPYKLNQEFDVMDVNTTSPLKLFEYLAAGKPIISSKIQVIEKVVEHRKSSLLAEPGNILELASYIKLVIEDTTLATKLSVNAKNLSSQYDWKERCQRIVEIVNQNS